MNLCLRNKTKNEKKKSEQQHLWLTVSKVDCSDVDTVCVVHFRKTPGRVLKVIAF